MYSDWDMQARSRKPWSAIEAILDRKRLCLTGDLPLRSVLAPKTNAKVVALDTNLAMQLDQSNTHVGSPLLHGLIVHPHIVVPRLGGRIPRAIAKARTLWLSRGSGLENVMAGFDLKVGP